MKKSSIDKKTLAKVFHYVKRHMALILLSVLCALITTLLSLWIPLRIGHAIDCIVDQGNVDFTIIGKIIIEEIGRAHV